MRSVSSNRRFCSEAAVLLLAGVWLIPGAQAAERLNLTNGLDVVCDHHVMVEGRVRVFPQATGADFYELSAGAVRSVEVVPDPVPEPKGDEPVVAPSPSYAKVADSRLTAEDLHQLLAKAGSEHNVDEDLLASVVKAESGGNTHARSRAGARGLMQLMPGTAQELGVTDSFVPEQNVRGGTAYLDSLLTRYHDNIALALAAYNAGPEAVDRYHGIPPYHETRVYVARVVHEFNRRVAARRRSAGLAVSIADNQRVGHE